jgi:6-phosphogluconolactonase
MQVRIETVVDEKERLADAFRRRVELLAAEALSERGRFALALSGGSVAETFLPELAEADLDWSRVEVFWCDERGVPQHHPDSNYALARRLLLGRVALEPSRIHRMRADIDAIGLAASEYEAELRRALGDPPALDVALLGVGPDGHVCSLFAGHRALLEKSRLVVQVAGSPKPPPRRLTLTLPALRQARLLVVGAIGEGKAEVMRQGLYVATSTLPVAIALRQAPRALVLLDPAAAAKLRQTD